MNRNIATLVTVGTIGVMGVAGAGAASALSASPSTSNDSLITRLVEKFNLDQSEVEAVFDEEKTARDEERKADRSGRLQDAVDDGNITAEQKTLIEQKLSELETAREAEQAELEKWVEDNGIDLMGRGPGNSNQLDDAVEDGDLTDEQKTLIENKQEELEDAREEQQDALEQWAEDNDVDERYLMGGMGGGHGPGFGGMR